MKKLLFFLPLTFVCGLLLAEDKSKTNPAVAPMADTSKPKKPAGITDKIKSSRKIDGLFTIYQDTVTGSIQLYVKKEQLGFIYQSFSINGPTQLYLNQSMHRATSVFTIKKAFDKIEFSQVNTSFYYDADNLVSKTKDVDKPEAVFFVEKTSAEDADGYLVNADGLFISEKLDPVKPASLPGQPNLGFNLGMLNAAKSKVANVRSVYRQCLQTASVKMTADIMDPVKIQYDDIAKAAALHSLRKLKTQLATAVSTNEETRAHRANLLFRINKATDLK